MATTKKDTTRGSNFTAKGTLPETQLKRFGIKGNIGSSEGTNGSYETPHQREFIRRMTRRMTTLRQMSGACPTETHLPAPLKAAVRYFSIPFGREVHTSTTTETSA